MECPVYRSLRAIFVINKPKKSVRGGDNYKLFKVEISFFLSSSDGLCPVFSS